VISPQSRQAAPSGEAGFIHHFYRAVHSHQLSLSLWAALALYRRPASD
jgi:hypothetical protein